MFFIACEIHPRTYKILHLPNGKTIVVSSDNDYYNSFDVKAEGPYYMIYAQVKYMPGPTVTSGHISQAMKHIDRNYPYDFPYQRIQIWQVWRYWIKTPRRHKEFGFRVWDITFISLIAPPPGTHLNLFDDQAH